MTLSLLAEREQLIEAAISLDPPDRVPVVYMAEAFSPRFVGMSMADYVNDPQAPVEAALAAHERLGGYDAQNFVPGGLVGPLISSGWLTRVRLPGRELPDDALWQLDEGEDMTVEEYDRVLSEGWPPVYESILPRVLDVDELADALAWLEANFAGIVAKFRARGIAPMAGSAIASPFEILSGARSMGKFYMDLYRRPELVSRVMDKMLPGVIADTLAAAQASGLRGVWVGGWRSAPGMLSEPLWMEFVLPHLKIMVHALVDAGLNPILHFDQDWTRDLVHLRELPARKCILQLDGMTDIRRAKEVLGDHMAIMGDVPPALLVTGSAEDVRVYVRDLIRDIGDRGFLLAPGCDAPINARPENMQALCDAGHEFGS